MLSLFALKLVGWYIFVNNKNLFTLTDVIILIIIILKCLQAYVVISGSQIPTVYLEIKVIMFIISTANYTSDRECPTENCVDRYLENTDSQYLSKWQNPWGKHNSIFRTI